jgi:hypothetical protein
MNKRASGQPRRPRNPVAKAVRTPQYKPQVVPDKRWKERLKQEQPEPASDKPEPEA